MPPLVPGQSFTSLAEFKDALRLWAVEASWTPHILDSDSHRVRAGCRSSPDCPFRIRANYSAKRGNAQVTTVDDIHTCAASSQPGSAHQNIKRAETGKLKFLLEAVPTIIHVTLKTSIHEIIAAVEQKYGQKIPIRQAQKVKGALVTRVKGPCRHCHRMGHTRKSCPQLVKPALGPIDFANSALDFPNQDQSDDGYPDGGMDDTFDHTGINYAHDSPDHSHLYPRPHPQSVDPSLHNGSAGPAYVPSPIAPSRPPPLQPVAATVPLSLRTAGPNFSPETALAARHGRPYQDTPETPEIGPASDNRPDNRSPAEIRSEAARLVHQATQMMQHAAKLNTEASRLLASIGEGG